MRLRRHHKPAQKSKSKVTIGQVAREALHIETPRIGTAEQRRIAAALERLNWKRQHKDWGGKRWWDAGIKIGLQTFRRSELCHNRTTALKRTATGQRP
jgi:hypothetical protein